MARNVTQKITESYCIGHGRILNIDDFYKSPNPNHENKVLPYCKDCVQKICKSYIKKYGTIEAAVYFTCAEMGIPFVRKVYQNFQERIAKYKNVNNYFGNYLQSLYAIATKGEKEKWVDFGASDVDLKDIKSLQKAEKNIELERQELEIAWGKQYDSEQLIYLEYRFSAYTEGKILQEYEEMTYRNLCKAELDIYEDNDIESALKRQAQCAKILHLDSFEVERKQTLTEQMIESDIYIMEQEEPAEFYENKKLYQDFRGIGRSWVLEVLRPIKNLITGSKEYPIESEDLIDFDQEVDKLKAGEDNVSSS